MAGTTIWRTIFIGRLYLGIGSGMVVVLSLILLSVPRAAIEFPMVFPLEIPLFAILGSTGGLMTFASDRTKGVFEYLIAYGIPPRNLFFNGLISTIAMSSIILGVGLGVGLSDAALHGVALNLTLFQGLAYYAVPVSYAGALFTSTVGMIWSAVSTPRTGINSPVGIAPLIGIGPTILVLVLAESAPASEYYYITTGAAVLILALVIGLLALSARLMGRERFLSPL